ncbi:MAG TPA: PAS domain S-box protein [Candidatus Acidoferrum sp.]|nr:PAS domain S-box protein [Candidatus Acidoferrum sp.]
MLPSSKFSQLVLAVASLLTVLVILVVREADHLAKSQLLSDLLQTALVLCSGVSAIRATLRSSEYLRRLWRLFTVSLFLVVVAQVVETYYESMAFQPFATPWPSDIIFILWVIPALIMLLPRPDEKSVSIPWETMLDFSQVAIVALTAYLYFFYLTSRWEAEGQRLVMNEIQLQLYRDLAIAVAFLIRSRSESQPVRVLFRRVSLFFLLSVASSLAYLISLPAPVYRANWYDVVWCVPYLFATAFASGWKTESAATAKEQAPSGRTKIFLRVLPAAVPLLVLAMSRRIAQEQVTLAWAAITASFLISTARLILTNEKQLRIADNLRKAEAALRTSEERFRTLVENLHVGVALMGPGAEILFANSAALKMFGLSSEQVIGKTSEELGLIALREDGTEYPFVTRPALRALATGQPLRGEVMGWRRPGEEEILWILGEVVPLSSKDGQPDRLVTAFSDITKRKEAEEALHHLSARLLRLQDEERRRLGRELHDSLAQSVMAVNLDLVQVMRSSLPLDKTARNALAEARKVLREMSREIRTLSYLLHPPVLDELGLASAVKEYAQGFSKRSGIALEIDIQPDFPRMPQEAETAFFRIVQESLANIQKHSGSSTGAIRLWNGQGRVQLEIRDQGRGIAAKSRRDGSDVPRASRLGVGILGMRERMAQLGGTLEVQSNASGTAVHATILLVLEGTHGAPSDPGG